MNIKLKLLEKQFDGKAVLSRVSLDLPHGQTTVIIGPSGSGKTTLLRCIALIDDFNKGSLLLDNKFLVNANTEDSEKRRLRENIGMVFQEGHLWPHKTVLENLIEAPIHVNHCPKASAVQHAHIWLDRMDLREKANEYPNQLSGGQKQRVAIARTLMMNPDVILLDEITSALDPELILSLAKVVRSLAREGITMLIATHHMKFAKAVADKIIFLDNGRIVETTNQRGLLTKSKNARIDTFLANT